MRKTSGSSFRRLLTAAPLSLLFFSGHALAGLGASVTLQSGQPGTISPGETTVLSITLSNSSTTAQITSAQFSNSLPGTLPDGLKTDGSATYECYDPDTDTTSTGVGTLTLGEQTIDLGGGIIPANSGGTDGTCTIEIPVTAGTSDGSSATYTYTIAHEAVSGTDDTGTVRNTGDVSQSINVSALDQPTISKSFGSSTLVLGGSATTLTITLSNSNSVDITGVSINDTFPELSSNAIIEVAATPNANTTCSGSPSITAAAGAGSVSMSGATIPAGGSCTLTVDVEAAYTDGRYLTGWQTNRINRSSDFSNDIGISAAADATRSVRTRSPLRVSKSFSPSSLASGQTGSMTVTLSNDSDSVLTLATLFEDSPIDGIGQPNVADGGLWVTGASTTCGAGTASVTADNRGVRLGAGATIPANGSCTVQADFTATTQDPNTPVTYTNTIPQGAVDVGAADIVSQSASATILVADTLRVLKSNNSSNPRPGNPARYSITVQNWSSSDMSNVQVLDTLGNGMSYLTGVINGLDYTPSLSGTGCVGLATTNVTGDSSLSFTIGTVPQRSGDSSPGACTISFYAMTDTGAANGSSTINTINAGDVCTDNGSGFCNGGGANSGNSTVNTTVLSATKSFSPAGPLSEGTVSTMTITLSNYSVNEITSLSISDTLPVSGASQMRVANPANAATTCGGTITAVAGTTSVALNGGTLDGRSNQGSGAAGSCFLQVDVVGGAGNYTNTATVAGNETYADGTLNSANPITASANASITYTSALSASKSFSPGSVSSGGQSTVTVRLDNTGSVALTNVAVTDPFPSGMVLASPPNAYSTCAGSPSISANAGDGSITMSGASIAGNGSCDLLFDVVATGSSDWTNSIPAGGINADGGVYNTTAVTATLGYDAPTNLTVAKATNPSTLTFPGQVSQLTITITNGTQDVSNLALSDYFTSDGTSGAAANGMVIAATPSASTTCPGGLVSATAGDTSVSLSGASLSASASCTVSVNVTSTAVGGITNYIPAGAISTDQGLSNSGQATTSLTTQSNIGVAKQFTPDVIKSSERSRLRITFYNPTTLPMADLALTDTLPANMTVPSGPNQVTTCSGATITNPATDQVGISGGSLPASSGGTASSCYLETDVVVSAEGDYINTIPAGDVTASSGGSSVNNSQPATATLRARSPLEIHKAIDGFTLDSGDPAGFTTGSAGTTPGSAETLTVRLSNPNSIDLTGAAFTDSLPSGLVVAQTPNAATSCSGGTVTAGASATSFRLSGATIPASGSCTVSVDVLSNVSGSYTNTIAAAAVSTNEGISNEEPTSAQLVVSTPPTVDKQFAPAVIPQNGTSTLTLYFGNDNSSTATLTSAFTDSLPTAPGSVVIATPNNLSSSCSGSVTAAAGSGSITLASGAGIPAGGCSISVDVTGDTSGDHNNSIPAGDLQTDLGNNQSAANATLTISDLGYISGRVFQDNNTVPNGSYESGTDTPLSGVGIELRSGVDCSGALVDSTTTDSLGNYLFSGLAADTYSVCELVQPGGTVNGITTAGVIVSSNGSSGTAGSASNPTGTSSRIAGIVLNGDGGSGEVSGSTGNDFAEVVQSGISGTVFLDPNNNGIRNGADSGISGVTIELTGYSYGPNGIDDSGAGDDVTVSTSTTTDSNGDYSFNSLDPGVYTVTEPTQPTDTANGITTAGTSGGTATAVTTTPSVISAITLPPNTDSTDNNFAEIPRERSLYGQVFLDYDNDGVLDDPPDHGASGQTVNLTGSDINGNPVSDSTTTATDGTYGFTGLPEGTYTVTQPNQPAGTTNGITSAGSTGGSATGVATTPSEISGIDLTGANTVSGDNDFAEVPDAAPDLAIAKSHAPASFGEGSSNGYYTITPSNVGTVDTSGTVTVVDTLPTGMTVAAAASGTGWSCSGAVGAGSVTCTTTTPIAAGAGGNPITLFVAVANGLSGQILTNTAVISGGGEPPGFDSNNTATDPTPIAGNASVAGHVWYDTDHDRVMDGGEELVPDWTVELLLSGVSVATTTTDATGAYSFTSLSPGSGYQIRFRNPTTGTIFGSPVPNESGNSFTDGVVSTDNPAGASTADRATLDGLTLLSGDNVQEQSLPLDPAGVIYDAISGLAIAGATVELQYGGGAVPAGCLVGGNPVVTGADGMYQFLLTGAGGCPGSGTYTIAVTGPGSYLPTPSTFVPPCGSALTVGAVPDPAEVRDIDPAAGANYLSGTAGVCPATSAGLAPANQASAQYYFDLVLTLGVSANVVNNHIPLDPILEGAVVATKTTPKRDVVRGELVPYTLTFTNTLAATLTNIDLTDQVPPGFKYRPGTARLDGVATEPTVSGRELTWANQTIAASETRTIRMILVVGAGVGEGEYTNQAWAENNLAATRVSNIATATVRVTPDPTFDCSDLIGKVFDDRNANGYQDKGEPGIPNVRVATVRGLLVTTDDHGRFHVACADVPHEARGANFIMKLDEHSLPTGYRITTENPRVVRLTRGKITKLNFGAAIHRVVRLDLLGEAFQGESERLKGDWLAGIDRLLDTLKPQPSVLRIAYAGREGEPEDLARSRLEWVIEQVRSRWEEEGDRYPLEIETEFYRTGKAGGAQ
jgi:uncharacterized repeat protein (TIGR01451 family)